MSLLKTQFETDNETSLEEKKYQNDHNTLYNRKQNTRSPVENNDIRDFQLRGIPKNMLVISMN